MNKTAVVFALTLMLLTGLVVGQIYSLGAPGLATVPASNPQALRTSERFYMAVNTLLESGDASSLRAVLHPGFIDHAAGGEDPGTARDLETELLAVRASF